MVKWDISVLENDMKKVITRTNWNAIENIVGTLGSYVGDGVWEYANMPRPYQDMILDYIREHPQSRLSKAYCEGENIRMKPY